MIQEQDNKSKMQNLNKDNISITLLFKLPRLIKNKTNNQFKPFKLIIEINVNVIVMSFYQGKNTHQNSFDPVRTEESRIQSNSPSGTESRKHLKKDPPSYQQL